MICQAWGGGFIEICAGYFGTQGFFHDYNIRPKQPLAKATAEIWFRAARQLRSGAIDAAALARAVAQAEADDPAPITADEYNRLALEFADLWWWTPHYTGVVHRGTALAFLWRVCFPPEKF